MTVSETYTAIGDAIRRQYGATDKYKLADMPTLIDNLEVKNLLEAGQTFDSTVNRIGYDLPLKGATIDDWNSVAGKTVTISFDVTWTGYTYTPGGSRNRIGFEHHLVNETGLEQYVGAWLTPDSESGTKHITETYRVISGKIIKVDEGNFYTQTNCSSIKATNLKIVENPMGEIESSNLFDVSKMQLEKATRYGTLFTFEDNSNPNGSVYTDFLFQHNIPLKKNTAYQLSFSTCGTGTIVTYVYGNNSSGKYIDNAHWWGLTNQWQEFQQYLPPESVPLNAYFNFRSATNCSGEVTNLKLTPLE